MPSPAPISSLNAIPAGVSVGELEATFRRLAPLQLRLADLLFVVMPIIDGDAWATDTVIDLWTMGAPTPGSITGTPEERRIVFPGQLAKWLSDVLVRRGAPLDAAAAAYVSLMQLSR